MDIFEKVCSVRLDDENDQLVLLDQTLLPNETRYLYLNTPEEIYEAIYYLRVRGAPAIGVSAAYGVYLTTKHYEGGREDFDREFTRIREYLNSSRPTAVNLSWALNRMGKVLEDHPEASVPEIKELLHAEAEAIHDEDVDMCRRISENGLTLLKPGMGLLTHCNAGTIATSKYGTALGPMYLGKERGYDFRVFADETRPLLQGARLTAWELHEAGVDVTLVCDNMVSLIMRNGWIDACLVGCDRVAANGDTANKIGTSTLSIVAKNYGVPVYVLGPTSTIDMNCPTGDDIKIELRPEDEISEMWYARRMAPEGIKAYNPAFDVTDHAFISAIVTEKGIVYPPFDVNLRKLMEQ